MFLRIFSIITNASYFATAKSMWLTRKEILEATGLSNVGSTIRVLDELEQSNFIRRYTLFGQKERAQMYQLTDAYTLFYFLTIVR